MSYTVTQTPVQSGETAVALNTGELVAVSVNAQRCAISQNPTYFVNARVLNADGSTKPDAHAQPILTSMSHKTSDAELAALTEAVIIKECVLLALGEPPTKDAQGNPLIGWSVEIRDNASIRRAIKSAAMAGPVNLAAII
jgi:hypothetical protein